MVDADQTCTVRASRDARKRPCESQRMVATCDRFGLGRESTNSKLS
jgi:hypothetical protein